jgi:hypothetical protein
MGTVINTSSGIHTKLKITVHRILSVPRLASRQFVCCMYMLGRILSSWRGARPSAMGWR